jgi:hypothetical protein
MLHPSLCISETAGGGTESDQAAQQAEDIGGMSTDSDWHALSPKEETDLDTIMSQCEFAVSNAELFAEQLSRDLSVLDGVSILLHPNLSACNTSYSDVLSM